MKSIEHYLSRTEKVGDCLIWSGALATDGYPIVFRNKKLHREVYKHFHEQEDIDDKVVRHTCDNPTCINPDHLLSGTPADNIRDRDSRERHGLAKLTIKDVREIRDLAAVLKRVTIAERYGVDPRTVSSVILRTHFKHVE